MHACSFVHSAANIHLLFFLALTFPQRKEGKKIMSNLAWITRNGFFFSAGREKNALSLIAFVASFFQSQERITQSRAGRRRLKTNRQLFSFFLNFSLFFLQAETKEKKMLKILSAFFPNVLSRKKPRNVQFFCAVIILFFWNTASNESFPVLRSMWCCCCCCCGAGRKQRKSPPLCEVGCG